MTPTNRRGFLSDVGRGMLAAGLRLKADDLASTFAEQGSDRSRLVSTRPPLNLCVIPSPATSTLLPR
jgi:hypothetical protein